MCQIVLTVLFSNIPTMSFGIARAEPDGTRAETKFRLSPKRTSPFKSVGESVQSTVAAEVCASALVMLDRPRSEVVLEYWLPTPFVSFPFTFPSHASPCATTFRTLYSTIRFKQV